MPLTAPFSIVRFWPKADMSLCAAHVRFWGQSGHGDCIAKSLLITQGGDNSARDCLSATAWLAEQSLRNCLDVRRCTVDRRKASVVLIEDH